MIDLLTNLLMVYISSYNAYSIRCEIKPLDYLQVSPISSSNTIYFLTQFSILYIFIIFFFSEAKLYIIKYGSKSSAANLYH